MGDEYVASEKTKEEASEDGLPKKAKFKKPSLIKPEDFDTASDDEKRVSEYRLAYLGVRWARLAVIIPTLVTLLIAVGIFNWVPRLVESAIRSSETNLISESEFNSLISIFLAESSQIDEETREKLAYALESRKYYAAILILDTVIDSAGDEPIHKGNITYFRALIKLMVKEFPGSLEDFRTAYDFYEKGGLQYENTIRNTVVGMVKLKENGFADENEHRYINEAEEYVVLTNVQWKFSERAD